MLPLHAPTLPDLFFCRLKHHLICTCVRANVSLTRKHSMTAPWNEFFYRNSNSIFAAVCMKVRKPELVEENIYSSRTFIYSNRTLLLTAGRWANMEWAVDRCLCCRHLHALRLRQPLHQCSCCTRIFKTKPPQRKNPQITLDHAISTCNQAVDADSSRGVTATDLFVPTPVLRRASDPLRMSA